MDFQYTKEQEEWRRVVRCFAETEIAPLVPQMEQDDIFPEVLVTRMGELGLMGIPIPSQLGGAGSDFISYILAINEISKVSATVGVILSVHTSVGTFPIMHYGSVEQQMKYVTNLASGKSLGAFALTESQAGSDASAIRSTATLIGDYYLLNGTKVFITNAGAADSYITFAVTDHTRGSNGITAFIVENDSVGLRIGRKERKMGLHGSNTCELIFDQMRVPVTQRLGKEGEGFTIAKGSLDGGRIGIAAQALGIAEASLKLVEQHFIKRNKGGALQIKGNLQPFHTEIAALTTRVEAARLLVYHAAYLRQEGMPCTKESSTAKMFASDTAVEVTSKVISLLGKQGCIKDLMAERYFRDAKVTQIYEGTNEIHRIVISSQLLR